MLADAISSIQSFISVFTGVYVLLIFAYILTSWIRLPYSPTLNRIQRFLYDVCEPYLRIFRRFLPPLGPLDLSPIVGRLRADPGREDCQRASSKGSGEDALITPVEIRHVPLKRALFGGYRRAPTDRLLLEIADSFEEVWRERPTSPTASSSSRTTSFATASSRRLLRQTLVSAERTAAELRDGAQKQAELVVEEAHAVAREIVRAARAERERLAADVVSHPGAARPGRSTSSTRRDPAAEAA